MADHSPDVGEGGPDRDRAGAGGAVVPGAREAGGDQPAERAPSEAEHGSGLVAPPPAPPVIRSISAGAVEELVAQAGTGTPSDAPSGSDGDGHGGAGDATVEGVPHARSHSDVEAISSAASASLAPRSPGLRHLASLPQISLASVLRQRGSAASDVDEDRPRALPLPFSPTPVASNWDLAEPFRVLPVSVSEAVSAAAITDAEGDGTAPDAVDAKAASAPRGAVGAHSAASQDASGGPPPLIAPERPHPAERRLQHLTAAQPDMLTVEFLPDGQYRMRELRRMDVLDEARASAFRRKGSVSEGGKSLVRRRTASKPRGLSEKAASGTVVDSSAVEPQRHTEFGGGAYEAEPRLSKRSRRQRNRRMNKGALLQLRDLRCIDPSFASFSSPALLVRRHSLLLNAPPVRALILADKCFLFLVGEQEYGADGILRVMLDRLRRPSDDPQAEPPFELKALEALLITACAELEKTTAVLAHSVHKLLHQISQATTALRLDELRLLKSEVKTFHARTVRGIARAITAVLDEPADLSLMYLTRRARGGAAADRAADGSELKDGDGSSPVGHFPDDDDHEEAEVLLESYLAEVETVQSRIDQLREDIESSESQSMMMLHLSRNRLHKLEIFFTLLAACVGAGSLVAGFFGMNLANGFEDDVGPITSREAFWMVATWTSVAVAIISCVAACFLYKAQI